MFNFKLSARTLLGFSALTVLLAGCGGGTPAAPAISVVVSPTVSTLIGGASQTFSATVTNDSTSAGVTWTASAGAITSGGVYTAPSPVTTSSATVTATSKADATKTASATITLTPIAVTVAPTSATLVAGATQTFAATVTSDNASAGVTWTASAGSITAAGVYTAPTPVATASATITATSKTDTTKTATATVTLTPIAVTVAPTTATLIGGATQTFTPTVTGDTTLNQGVTWTASTGSITAAGVYTAPAVVTTTSATVTATSKTDITKTATATITLTPISVAISPATPTSMIGNATQALTATVTGDGSSSGVTWTVTGGGSFSAATTLSGVATTYTAASPVTTATAVVTATSVKDPTKSTSVTITLTPISLNAIIPAAVSLGNSNSSTFTDTLTGDGSNSGVTWSIGTGPGTLTASSSTGVTYNSPTTVIGAVTTVTLTATSIKDPTKSTTATITLNPISVAISPAAPAAMIGGATQAFTATAGIDGSNSGVTWSVTGGGSFSAGTTLTGVATTYTAASPVTAATAVVTATSVKDPSKSASVTITLTPISVTFQALPLGLTLDSGQPLVLTAGVFNDSSASGANFTASGAGTISPTSATGNGPITTLTATGAVASSVTVTATSIKDPTKSATTASITVNPALAITTAPGALTAGLINTVYSGSTIATAGGSGTKTFAIASGALPAGLGIGLNTGVISGTPTGSGGTATFTVKVTDAATTPVAVTSGTYTIAVTAPPLAWVAPTTGTLTYTVGTPITPLTLSTTGGTGTITYSVNSGSLPTGLSIVGNQVVGTPTAPTVVAGNIVNFLATDSATPTAVTAVSANITLIANPVTLAITSAALPAGTVGAPYNGTGYQLTSTGGITPINWTITSGTLTGTGLSMTTGGLISGTPTTTQSGLSLTFQAKDSAANQQQTVTKILSLTVSNALTITTGTSLPNATTNASYNQSLGAAGGTGTGYTWTVTAGATGTNSLATLGLAVSSAGAVTGTPTTTGTANFTVQVKDSSNNTATASFTVNAYAVLALPAPNPTSLPSAVVNTSYTGSINASGGVGPNYTWTVNGSSVPTNGSSLFLSNGLSVSNTGGNTLNVTGTPSSGSTVTFTASVTDSAPNTAGPVTYTIAVATLYNVSGTIRSTGGCNGSALSGIKVAITQGSTIVQTVTTDVNGNFLFMVPNGTYTVTPSIVGPSSVFYPATQAVTVSGSDLSSNNFSAALGYTVSGTVAYTGTQTGQIYLSLNGNNCGGGGSLGTSISAKGAYTIRGVPPGTYTLNAFMDTLGQGVQNASNPTGTTVNVGVTTANLNGISVTLGDATTVTLSAGPSLKSATGFNTGALVQFKPITDSNGIEMATSYTLQWSTTSGFTAIAGSKTFPAVGTHSNVWFLTGLTNGSVYYFRAFGTSAGTATSAFSSAIGPITIQSPAGGNTVSGSVTFTGTATGPLYVAFVDNNTNSFYGTYIASPVSAQAYTVQVPTGSNYFFAGIIDQNNDGVIDAGDISNTGNDNNTITVISGATANQNLTLSSANSTASVTTQNYKQINSGGTSQNYNLSFQVNAGIKQPVAVTLTSSTNASGANVVSPMDIARCNDNNGCGQGFQIGVSLAGTAPSVGDAYTFNVAYASGTPDTVTATVTTVLSAFATTLAPTTGTSVSTTPTFTWTDPLNASNYTYSFYMNDSNGNTIWQIPGNNSKLNGFSSSITSIPWITSGNDVTGTSGNLPSVTALTLGINYNWQIQVQDAAGNSAVMQVSYQP